MTAESKNGPRGGWARGRVAVNLATSHPCPSWRRAPQYRRRKWPLIASALCPLFPLAEGDCEPARGARPLSEVALIKPRILAPESALSHSPPPYRIQGSVGGESPSLFLSPSRVCGRVWMACARARPDLEDTAANAQDSQVRDPSETGGLRCEGPAKTDASPCCLRTLKGGRGCDEVHEVDLAASRSSPCPFQGALCHNAHLMVHSPSSRNITRKAKHGQACPHKQHIVNEEAPPIMGVRTAMLQNDFVKDDGECACICPSMLAASNHEPSDVSCHATRVPSVTTLLDIEVEPGGAQNILVPDRAIGPSPTASSNPTHSIYERACIYDPPFCNVAPPVPSCTHGATLVARDAQPTIVKLDNLVMHNAGSQTLQTLAATSTTSSPGVGSIVGPLLGGLLGGFFGLILIVAALWYIWTSRHRLLNRQDTMESQTAPVSPNFEYKRPDRSSRRQSTLSSVPTPMPYQYGVVGRPRSQLSMTMTNTSSPHSPDPTRSRSRSHSPGPSVLTYSRPPSMTMNMMGPPSPTPAGINTPISPGPSLAPSSRPPTPGPGAAISYPPPLQQYHSDWQQQQQQARISWPQMSHSEDGHGADARRSPVLRPHSERRPSRLSLTLANWNPETDGILGELAGGGMPVARSGEAGAVASTACSTTAVGSSREGGGGGDLDAEASQETLTPANPGPGNPPRRGS